MVKAMQKVLAFFGAFNPPTNAHVKLAEYAMVYLAMDGVVFVPSKSDYITDTQAKDYAFEDAFRLDMLRDLSAVYPWLAVSDHDIKSETQPRTYDTLCALKEEGYDPVLLIGSDVLTKLQTDWLHVDKIAQEFGIACLNRDGADYRAFVEADAFLSPFKGCFRFVPPKEDFFAISSTDVRAKFDASLSAWKELCGAVDPVVSAHLLAPFMHIVLGESNEI